MAIRPRNREGMVLAEAAECSHCGCKDFRLYGTSRHCRHCGKPWIRRLVPESKVEVKAVTAPAVVRGDPNTVSYHVVRCPSCGSKNTKVSSTRRPIRHHKCKDCEHNFKSEEE